MDVRAADENENEQLISNIVITDNSKQYCQARNSYIGSKLLFLSVWQGKMTGLLYEDTIVKYILITKYT